VCLHLCPSHKALLSALVILRSICLPYTVAFPYHYALTVLSPFFYLVKEPEELFETVSQALMASVDRDCLAGWGGYVLIVTPTEVQERVVKGRMD